MDLHSILNASDSDDDEQEFRGSFSLSRHHQPYSGGPNNVDLEQILRDDDDDDVDDDEIWTSNAHCHEDLLSLHNNNSNDNGSDHRLKSSDSKSIDNHHFSTAHSAEDWAVLQALLGEDPEETEGGEFDWMHASNGSSYNNYKQDVDAILLSDNDDDTDDNNTQEQMSALSVSLPPVPTAANLSSFLLSKPLVSSTETEKEEKVDTSGTTSNHSTTRQQESNVVAAGATRSISSNGTKQEHVTTSSTPAATKASRLAPVSKTTTGVKSFEEDEKKVSERALAHAQTYERKLLRSGHRDIVSPLRIKRRLKQKIELNTRAQRRNNPLMDRIGTGTLQQRCGVSGVVESRTMKGVTSGLRPDSLRKKGIKTDVGLPTALAMNSKFIAVGTQRGIILVFDLFEVLKQVLNASSSDETWNSKHAGSITSIDLNMNDEVLVAGYTSGFIVLWDTIRGVMLRTVTETHPSPITSVRFLSDLRMVSVDAGGLVNKLTFAKTMLWSTYSMETECLLDGTAGQILAMNVLPPMSTVNPQLLPESANVLRRLVLIALSSERSSFAVAVEPSVNVLHRWAKPPTDRIEALPGSSLREMIGDQTFLPCLSWGWALTSGGGNLVAPVLARAWGCCVQLLIASFPSIDDGADRGSTSITGNGSTTGSTGEIVHWPAFGLHGEFDIDDPIVALEWLNDRSLAYLTVTAEFTVVDTVMMTLIDRLDFSGLKLVYAEFSLSRSAEKVDNNLGGETNSTFCSTFLNSIRSSEERLLVLCQEELKVISIVAAKKRITALEEDGEWLEALAVALDHYESTVQSQEDRKRSPDAKLDLSKHPEFLAVTKNEEDEWISMLLIRYLNLAVDNAPESPLDEHGLLSLDGSQAIIDLAQSHFQMLAGVCVEFCVVTRRLDLLFGQIFRRFQSVGFTSVFLDVLEPYVLNDKLPYIAPEAMTYFVDHCKATNGIATVERCLLHMDVRIMDFDSILTLLKKNQMYSALFYVMNQGLDDFVTPLEFLFENLFDAADNGSITTTARRSDGVPRNDFERLGYKAILYIQSCFRGKAFPKETNLSPEERLSSLRAELLIFLLRESYVVSFHHRHKEVFGNRALRYPYTRIMLNVDARALMDSVALSLESPDGVFVTSGSNVDPIVDVGTEGISGAPSSINGNARAPDMQQVVSMLSCILLPGTAGKGLSSATLYPSKSAVNAYLDFLAGYLMKGVVLVSESITFMILTRMAERFAAAKGGSARLTEQRQVLDLLAALPRHSYDPDEVLKLVGRTGIHRAALLLHQEGASWDGGIDNPERRPLHFSKAIDCYLEDDDLLFRKEVFDYVKKECSGMSETPYEVDSSGGSSNALRESLFTRMPDLVHLDALMTAELVAELFVDDLHRVVDLMDKADSGESQFLFFQAIISGNLNDINPVAGSVLNAHLAMEHHHKYLSLMAQLHPDLVYEYLSTHDNYRAEECLKLCQDHNIADASAYLLERMGHVSSALQLILQTLESRMMSLKRTIRGMGLDGNQPNYAHFMRRRSGERSLLSTFTGKQAKEVDAVQRLLVVALDVCERNSGTSPASEHGSQLWFNVLDRLINAKGFLRLSKEQPAHARVMASVLSDLLRLTMQRMVSSVPLTDLVRKVTSDHSGSRLGELREMIDSLLSTYRFELKVFNGAAKVCHHDLRTMHLHQRKLKLEGSGVSKLVQFPLLQDTEKETEPTAVSFLEKTKQSGCALLVGEGGNSSFVDNGSVLQMQRKDTGLVNAMARLRARRSKTSEAKPSRGRLSATLNFMTTNEKDYEMGENDNLMNEPVIGQLSEAEHRGRLMSFI